MVKLFRCDGMCCWEKPIENTPPPVFVADRIAGVIMTTANFFVKHIVSAAWQKKKKKKKKTFSLMCRADRSSLFNMQIELLVKVNQYFLIHSFFFFFFKRSQEAVTTSRREASKEEERTKEERFSVIPSHKLFVLCSVNCNVTWCVTDKDILTMWWLSSWPHASESPGMHWPATYATDILCETKRCHSNRQKGLHTAFSVCVLGLWQQMSVNTLNLLHHWTRCNIPRLH